MSHWHRRGEKTDADAGANTDAYGRPYRDAAAYNDPETDADPTSYRHSDSDGHTSADRHADGFRDTHATG